MDKPRRRSIVAPLLLLSAAVLSCVSPAHAQLTTVTGTLRGPMGSNRLAATLTFKALNTFRASDGSVIFAQSAQTVNVVNGAWTVQLIPTGTAYYEVTGDSPLQTTDGRDCERNSSLVSQGGCFLPHAKIGPLYLTVPTSATPVNFGDLYVTKLPPAPPILINLSQLNTRTLAAGAYCITVDSAGVASLAQSGCPGSAISTLFDSFLGLFDSAPGLFDDGQG